MPCIMEIPLQVLDYISKNLLPNTKFQEYSPFCIISKSFIVHLSSRIIYLLFMFLVLTGHVLSMIKLVFYLECSIPVWHSSHEADSYHKGPHKGDNFESFVGIYSQSLRLLFQHDSEWTQTKTRSRPDASTSKPIYHKET